MSSILLEIAVFNYTGLQMAAAGGAHRIELCSGYHDGGTTASKGMLEWAAHHVSCPVFPIIRPRGGDFQYTQAEWQMMASDIAFCRDLGFGGVVIGGLDADQSIAVQQLRQLIRLAYPMEITFHRAFDHVKDQETALRQLVDLGCQRVLTSGGAPTAQAGIPQLKRLAEIADNQITILAGGGIRSNNLEQILQETGVTEVHSAALSSKGQQAAGQEVPDADELSALLRIVSNHTDLINESSSTSTI